MPKVFWLSDDVSWNNQLRYASGMQSATKLCAFNPVHAASQKWVRPLKVIGPVRPLTDFECTVYADILVGEKVVTSLRSAGFSGIKFARVELLTTTETPIGRDLWELRVCGWGGMAGPQSGVRVLEECPGCEWKIFSAYTNSSELLNPQSWDGSDFFVIWPLPRYIMITDRVRQHILDLGYSGVQIRALESLPDVFEGTLTPGPLSDWLDAKEFQNRSEP